MTPDLHSVDLYRPPPIKMIARILLPLVMLAWLSVSPAIAADQPVVEVVETYLDLRTGPGRGYPVTQIVERRDQLKILGRRTEWIRVETTDGRIGWIHQLQMQDTLDPDGNFLKEDLVGYGPWAHRRLETGFKSGTFDKAQTLGLFMGYYFTANLSVEATVSEAYSSVVDFQFINVSVNHQPWPQWRYSPYFALGGGSKNSHYSVAEQAAGDRTDQTLHAGLGLKIFLSKHLTLRGEYRSVAILTDRQLNDESDEWTLGLSAFF